MWGGRTQWGSRLNTDKITVKCSYRPRGISVYLYGDLCVMCSEHVNIVSVFFLMLVLIIIIIVAMGSLT